MGMFYLLIHRKMKIYEAKSRRRETATS